MYSNNFCVCFFFFTKGTGHQATNWKVIRDLKLTHIINISIEHQCLFADRIKYLHIELEDKEDVLLKDAKGNISRVVVTDVEASNGIIHAIDTVIMPE